jgi:adenylate cyclase
MRQLTEVLAVFTERQTLTQRHLPERVHRLIEQQEDNSERLIGWVQLLVVGLFGILYLIAPRPADAPRGGLLDPVPIALAAYALFTVARLATAYQRRLPGWLLLISILADVGLLIGLIWSFHGQYGQAAPFSLKVPTFVYLFVFISVRALRFDHRYVLVAGLAAALGWLTLVIAVLARAGTETITRSFSAHLNSSMVLIGAEFDKILALLLVTGVLAFAVLRGRGLFVTAVRDEAALEELTRFFGKGVSDTVVQAETRAQAGMAAERDAAVIMLDIRGFTTLSAGLAPRRVVAILTSLHARIIPIVRGHGGVIDKFMGDGIMVTFGAVSPITAPAASALRALDAVMAEALLWQQELAKEEGRSTFELLGAAVAGPVVFAVVGAGDRLEYTVIGEAVNLAAKLEKQNRIERTRALTTLATFTAARAQGYEPQGPVRHIVDTEVQGASGRLDLVVLAAA